MQEIIKKALQLRSEGKTLPEISKAIGKSVRMTALYLNPEAMRKHRERSAAQNRRKYATDPQAAMAASKKWVQSNRDKVNAAQRRRWAQNPARKEYSRNYYHALRSKDPNFALACKLRCALVNWAVKGTKKRRDGLSVEALVGCSLQEFREHLDRQFADDMNFDTYGDTWELDHIKPLMDFNLLEPGQLEIAFHWSNTRPLHPSLNRGRERRERGQWAAPKSGYVQE